MGLLLERALSDVSSLHDSRYECPPRLGTRKVRLRLTTLQVPPGPPVDGGAAGDADRFCRIACSAVTARSAGSLRTAEKVGLTLHAGTSGQCLLP